MGDLKQYFNNDYAWQWYQYGLEKKNDDIIKFTMHWIAFSWMYGDYSGGERTKIRCFCKYNRNKLEKIDPFSMPEIGVFLDDPVYDARGQFKEESKRIYKELSDEKSDKVERIKNLLLTFYQVRCNLFHGQKILHSKRDVELVEKSSAILQRILDAVLNDDRRH